MKFKLEQGMTVTMKPTGNFARGWDGKPFHGVVEKIGRKYAHISMNDYGRRVYLFEKETLRCTVEVEHNAGYELFPDDESFEREMDRRFLLKEIRSLVRDGQLEYLNLDEMKQVYSILTGEDAGDILKKNCEK